LLGQICPVPINAHEVSFVPRLIEAAEYSHSPPVVPSLSPDLLGFPSISHTAYKYHRASRAQRAIEAMGADGLGEPFIPEH
jgi:hypothetical protein